MTNYVCKTSSVATKSRIKSHQNTIGASIDDINAALITAEIKSLLSTIDTHVLTRAATADSRFNFLDANISSRMATFTYTPPDNATIAQIATYTDSIESRLPAALVDGKMDSTAPDVSALATTAQVNAIVPAIFSYIVENGLTLKDNLRLYLAVLTGKTTGVGTAQNEFLSNDGLIVRIRTTFDTAKNRLTVFLYGGD